MRSSRFLSGAFMSWHKQEVHFLRMAPCFFLIPQMAAHCATFSSLLFVLAACRGVMGHPMDARPQSFEALGGRLLFWVRCLMASFTGSRLMEAEPPLGLSSYCGNNRSSLHTAPGQGEACSWGIRGHHGRDSLMEMSLVSLATYMDALHGPSTFGLHSFPGLHVPLGINNRK